MQIINNSIVIFILTRYDHINSFYIPLEISIFLCFSFFLLFNNLPLSYNLLYPFLYMLLKILSKINYYIFLSKPNHTFILILVLKLACLQYISLFFCNYKHFKRVQVYNCHKLYLKYYKNNIYQDICLLNNLAYMT